MENVISNTEPLGYFSASIEEKHLDHVQQTMRAHGVHMQKSNEDPADNWQFFLLPKGTIKVLQKHWGVVPRYTVRLPDGYRFTLEQGPTNRDGFFTSPPMIFLDVEEEKNE